MGYIRCLGNPEYEITPMLVANGAQRVTLPVYADENIKIVTKIYPIGNSGDTNIIGNEFTTSGWVLHFSGRDTLSFRYSSSSPLTVDSNPFTIREIEMATQDGSFKIDGTVVTRGNTTSYNHYPIQLFGIDQGGNNASYVGIGEMKVYKDNALYMRLLPQNDYTNNTNRGYFYDAINGISYYSETSDDLFYVGGPLWDTKVHLYDSLVFNGSSNIIIPYSMNADYSVYCDFTTNEYTKNQAVIGNTISAEWLHFTQFENKWYYPTGVGGENNFSGELTGRHTVFFDDTGLYFDSVLKGSFTPTTASDQSRLVIAGRPVSYGVNLTGKIHNYKITSISTGNVIVDYRPAFYMGRHGLYNTVDQTFIQAGTGIYVENFT